MKNAILLSLFIIVIATQSFASEMLSQTAACRMEVKILGYEALDEDDDCVWLVEHITQVVEKCPDCVADLELIKEASQGYFDY